MDERDAVAKSRAHRDGNTTPTPGAQAANDDTGEQTPGVRTMPAEEVARLDERIAAKAQSGRKAGPRSHASTRSTGSQLSELEQDVAAKTRTERPTSDAPTQAGAVSVKTRTQLSQLEDNIAAKMRGGSVRSNNARAQLNQMEEDLAAKSRARSDGSTGRKVSARSRTQLSQAEQDVMEKSRAKNGRSPGTDLNRFEEEVNAKNRARPSSLQQDDIAAKNQYGSYGRPDVDADTRFVQEKFEDEHMEQKILDDAGDIDDLEKAKESSRRNLGHESSQKEGFNIPSEAAPPRGGGLHEPEHQYGTYDESSDNDLAVAVAVTPEEEDAFIPAAIEYEPDAKPPIYKNRRFRLYAALAVVLLVVIVVASVLVVSQTGNGPLAPTVAPTTLRDSIGIREQLIAIVGEERLENPMSSQSKAAEWLINEDSLALAPDADNLIQRYLLALFYFDTTQIKPWLSCNKPAANETDECEFLKLIRAHPVLEYEEVPWYRWLSGVHECNWAGVFCDEFNQTRALELTGQQIVGTFPTDMAQMPYLQSFTMTWNQLGGTLPSELAQMKHLLNIEFHYNFFSGVVPPEWYDAQALQRINVASNYLSGQVPTEIGQLSTMKGFFVFENDLTGTIPTEMGNMKFLSFTRWGRNFIHGSIPSELGKLEKLQEMWLHRNELTGTLPTELGNMRDMADLRLHYNRLGGPVRDEIYNMTQLKRIDLYDCNFTGTISPLIANLKVLQTFRIRENLFSGTIPTEMGLNSKLESVWMHTNDIQGTMPREVCELRGPRGLQVLDCDCNPTNGIGAPMVDCMPGCCTACCDRVTGVCFRQNEG